MRKRITLSELGVSVSQLMDAVGPDPAWTDAVTNCGDRAWVNSETLEAVVQESTPAGVPDDYEYVPPGQEAGDEYDVVESDFGGTYRSPEPVEDEDDSTGTSPTDSDDDRSAVDEIRDVAEDLTADPDDRDAVGSGAISDKYDLSGDDADIVDSFNDEAYADPSEFEQDEFMSIPEGAPVVARTESGETIAARIRRSGWSGGHYSARLETPTTNDRGGFALPNDSASYEVVAAPKMDDTSDQAKENLAVRNLEENVQYRSMPEETKESVDVAHRSLLAGARDADLALDMVSELSTIEDDHNRAFQRNGMAGVTLGYGPYEDPATAYHESGHWLATTLGYDTKRTVQSEEAGDIGPNDLSSDLYSSGEVPEFGDEVRFGDNAQEFDRFLFGTEAGDIPGEGLARAERAVANADPESFVLESEPSTTDEQLSELRSLSHGDLVVIEEAGVERIARFNTTEESVLGGDLYQFEVLYDYGEPTDDTYTNVRPTAIRGGQQQILGRVDKAATAANEGVDVDADADLSPLSPFVSDGGAGRGGSPDDSGDSDSDSDETRGTLDLSDADYEQIGEQLIAAANRSWARQASHKEAGRDRLAQTLSIDSGYSATNAHETLAKLSEEVETKPTWERPYENAKAEHGELLFLYLALMEPGNHIDDTLEELAIDLGFDGVEL